MAGMRPGSSLGVTALLDELLAEAPGQATARCELALPEGPPASTWHDAREAAVNAAGLSQQQAVSPRSRQIAELCGEMDLCLASLGKWEEESLQRVEALRRDLEVEYGFAYEEEVNFPTLEGKEAVGEDEEEEDGDEVVLREPGKAGEPAGEAYRRALLIQPPVLKADGWDAPRAPFRQVNAKAEDEALRLADEERIAKLRLEVELLRRKEAEMQQDMMQQWLDAEALDSSVPGVSDLAAWCMEVDGVLGESGNFLSRPELLDGGSTEGLEARLAEARGGLAQMEGTLDSARSFVDSEISELEKMLADRERDVPTAMVGRGIM